MTIFEEADRALLPAFKRVFVEVDGVAILALIAGQGEPLLMLHGDPQTHLCWHRIAPSLALDFTVVLPDLRGRGEGNIAEPTEDHRNYTKRAMAQEQLQVMRGLGFESFYLVGHDRGARTARRMALDHPGAVRKLAVLDIIPELNFYDRLDAELAQDYFYFNFLTQPVPVPEKMIAGDPETFMRTMMLGLSEDVVDYDPSAMAAYLASSTRPDAIVAMCECFRAGFHVDRDHDRQDIKAGRRITCPTLVGWGEKGVIKKHFDMRDVWSSWCDDARFVPLPSGHFIPEEAPIETLAAIRAFLK